MQLASYLEGGPLMWMMPLHLHVNNQKADYDDDDDDLTPMPVSTELKSYNIPTVHSFSLHPSVFLSISASFPLSNLDASLTNISSVNFKMRNLTI